MKAVTQSIQVVSSRLPHSKYNKHVKPYWRFNKQVLKDTWIKKHKVYRNWKVCGRPRHGIVFREYIEAKK